MFENEVIVLRSRGTLRCLGLCFLTYASIAVGVERSPRRSADTLVVLRMSGDAPAWDVQSTVTDLRSTIRELNPAAQHTTDKFLDTQSSPSLMKPKRSDEPIIAVPQRTDVITHSHADDGVLDSSQTRVVDDAATRVDVSPSSATGVFLRFDLKFWWCFPIGRFDLGTFGNWSGACLQLCHLGRITPDRWCNFPFSSMIQSTTCCL